jgi:hypothetical protein
VSKLLIAVCSCHRDREAGGHAAIRRSWGHIAVAAGIDVRFFVGGKSGIIDDPQPDEVWLPVQDDYEALAIKTKAIAGWFLKHDYTNLFKCDNDTFVIPQRLLESDFENVDYLGSPVGDVYHHGGVGYFLSRTAAEILVDSDVDDTAEDRWVGRMLTGRVSKANAGDKLHRFASWHFPTGMYGPKKYHPDSKWQETMARAYLGGKEGHDPRGLCFQDRNENGIVDGEYKVVLRIPGHDQPRILSKQELNFWQQHNLVAKVINPRW